MKLFSRSLLVVALSAGLAVSISSCSDSDTTVQQTPPAQPGVAPPPPPVVQPPAIVPVTVSIVVNSTGLGPAAFGENPRKVPAGTTVTWVNEDDLPHTVTSDTGEFDSGTLQKGQSFSHKFDEAGTYPYFCAIHGAASMSGTIEVLPSAEASPSPGVSPSPEPTESPEPSPIPEPAPSPAPGPEPTQAISRAAR